MNPLFRKVLKQQYTVVQCKVVEKSTFAFIMIISTKTMFSVTISLPKNGLSVPKKPSGSKAKCQGINSYF